MVNGLPYMLFGFVFFELHIDVFLYKFINDVKYTISDTFTVDQAIDRIGFGRFQLKLSLLTGLAWVCIYTKDETIFCIKH